jgi:O-acetyl-ADP-ribose deacetylase (regulator of RNase III)
MINYVIGNIFDLSTSVNALVNPVNCVGVMGKGLALAFKHKYPENYKFYIDSCEKGNVKIGSMLVYKTCNFPEYIINFPTKQHWKNNSELYMIEKGLIALVQTIKDLKICSIAIPHLGCGLGGLKIKEVSFLINKYLSELQEVNIIIIGF